MIDSKEIYKRVQEGKAVIIDVREEDEIKLGMIDKAEWFPISKVKNEENWLSDFRKLTDGKEIYLHCKGGGRSGRFETSLKEIGIEAKNIGGYEQLKNELPTILPVR